MCVPEKNPYNPIRTMYSCETLDCLGVHVCSDIDTEARSERALINVKKSPIFKTSDACRRVMLLLLLLLRERVGERVLPRRISPRSMPPPRHHTHTHTHTHLRIYGYMHVHALPLFIVVYMYVYTSVSLSLSFSASLSLSRLLFSSPPPPPRSPPLASTRLDSPCFFPSARPLVFSLSAVATTATTTATSTTSTPLSTSGIVETTRAALSFGPRCKILGVF